MKISLLQNAYSFLEEALSKAIRAEEQPIQWKYATLNLVQAIELSLKEKLRREHPILIFQQIDSPKNTVNLEAALSRLQSIGKLNFSQSDMHTISKASKLRNLIVHYEFELRAEESKLIFAKLLGFMSHFHTMHLDSPLDAALSGDLWQEALSIFDYAEELFNRAEDIFKEKGFDPSLIWTCAKCEWHAFVVEEDINTCYVCGFSSEIIECDNCREYFYIDDSHELQTDYNEFNRFCNACYEKIIREDDRYYHEMMSHFLYK